MSYHKLLFTWSYQKWFYQPTDVFHQIQSLAYKQTNKPTQNKALLIRIQVEMLYFPHISAKPPFFSFLFFFPLHYEFFAKCIHVTVRKQSILMMLQAVLMKQTELNLFFTSRHSLLIPIILRHLSLQVVYITRKN